MLMTAKTTAGQVALQTNTPIPVPDWETFMQGVATQILQNQTPQQCVAKNPKRFVVLVASISCFLPFLTLLLSSPILEQQTPYRS
jgi:hypothetical protein